MPPLEPGALVAVMGAGAYGFSMSSNYNSRPRVAEVLVKGEEFFVIRKREEYGDLVTRRTHSRVLGGIAMDSLQFFKMSASGNDFIIIDNRDGGRRHVPRHRRLLCKRSAGGAIPSGPTASFSSRSRTPSISPGGSTTPTARKRRCAGTGAGARPGSPTSRGSRASGSPSAPWPVR